MADPEKPGRRELEALRAFFDVYSRIDRKRGIDAGRLFAEFASHVQQRLNSPGGARTLCGAMSRRVCPGGARIPCVVIKLLARYVDSNMSFQGRTIRESDNGMCIGVSRAPYMPWTGPKRSNSSKRTVPILKIDRGSLLLSSIEEQSK